MTDHFNHNAAPSAQPDDLHITPGMQTALSIAFTPGLFLQLLEIHEQSDAKPTSHDEAKTSRPMRELWEKNVPVTALKIGDHIHHPKHGKRIISGIKPHPKSGVIIKTIPSFLFMNRCENPMGKTLKTHLTGHVERWDGSSYINNG